MPMPTRRLPDLEQTLGDLVLDLLRAPRNFPELVRSDPLDQRGDYSGNAVRVTQHYVAALLAYGFDETHEELQKTTDWFAVPFPNEHHTRVDAVEMTRLEALLLLGAPEQHITPRLQQLARQRPAEGDHFVIEGRGGDFDTLWALKVMRLADQRGLLHDLVDREQLRQLAGRVLPSTTRHKDLALALRLRHELAGKLRQSQLHSLYKLIDTAERAGGVWGLDQDMLWIAEYMQQQQLSPGDFANHREALREMIISTCYVIENLMPLAGEYPPLEEPLKRAMELWWGVIHGKHTVPTLQALFPISYDYLMVLSRTLVAARAYLDSPLIQWGAAHVHRKLAEQELTQAEPPDRDSIRRALRNWLRVDLDGVPERLQLGMSDADIVRVKPRLWNPMYPDEGAVQIPYADTLIVKFGRLDEINRERENYNRLPAGIHHCFARLPDPSFTDERGRAFLVLQDLSRYLTLEEILRRIPQARESVNSEIGPFLLGMHQGQLHQPRPAPYGLLWELYLLPMQEHVGRIFGYIQDHGLLEQRAAQQKADELKHRLLDLIGDLVRHQLVLEGFPMAHMHGDLHSRNIMVRRLRRHERAGDDTVLDFKLIDLEKFRLNGDSALDAGELLADLKLARASLKGVSDRRPLEDLIAAVEQTYTAFAHERGDETFSIRLDLAQARALIRVAKGRTKAGAVALLESRRAPAIGVAYEALNYATEAAGHLERVMAALQRPDQPHPADLAAAAGS
jgi:hypothetical protein